MLSTASMSEAIQCRVLSRKARSGTKGVEYVVGDLAKGTGVDDAVAGADVIVHSASSTRADAEAT